MILSVLIPCYNERLRLGDTICKIEKRLERLGYEWELVLVDDGSTDGTADMLRQTADRIAGKVVLVSWPQNRGKGAAVRAGLAGARGDWILLTDADLACPIEELEKLLARMNESDLIVGSRNSAGSLIEIKQPLQRVLLGKCYSRLSRAIFALPVADSTCGFKLFRAAAFQPLLPLARIDRWGYDTELLLIARLNGLRISEVGVRWQHCLGSKVKLSLDVFRTLEENFSILWRYLLGRYRLRK